MTSIRVLGAFAVVVGIAIVVGIVQLQRRRAWAARLPALVSAAVARLGAESTTFGVNGVRLHAVVAGPVDGPLAVLLHGFPECWYSWRHQIPLLVSLGYRVVAPDQRGYALSDKPRGLRRYRFALLTADVRALIEASGRRRALVIGHDWGGAVAWQLAMDHAECVERLVILDAPHPVAFKRELRTNFRQILRIWYMALFQLPWLPELLLGFAPRLTARFFFRFEAVQKGAFDEGDLDLMAASLAQRGALTTMLAWYRAAVWFPPKAAPEPIVAPTLLLWAENDPALGIELTEGLEPWVPNLHRRIIARCGHWVQNEAPDEVASELRRWLEPRAQARS
ncbi:MAG: alpha/beta hydrolase [Polyangiales bacterium]